MKSTTLPFGHPSLAGGELARRRADREFLYVRDYRYALDWPLLVQHLFEVTHHAVEKFAELDTHNYLKNPRCRCTWTLKPGATNKKRPEAASRAAPGPIRDNRSRPQDIVWVRMSTSTYILTVLAPTVAV